MKTSVFSIIIVFAVCLFLPNTCPAYPEPSLAGGLNDWTLDIEFGKPQQISIKLPGDPKDAPARRFWYIILSIKNITGKDVNFFPSCDLMTDTFKTTPAGKEVMGVVFEKIKIIQQGRYPFLQRLDMIDSHLLQGEDNARDIVVVWPDFDKKAKKVDLFIQGLSNETVAIDHPIKKNENGKPVKVYLQKTLQLKYSIGGDEKFRSDSNLRYKSKKWIMR